MIAIAGNDQGQAQEGGAGQGKGSASNGNSATLPTLLPTQQRFHQRQHHQQQSHALGGQGRPDAAPGHHDTSATSASGGPRIGSRAGLNALDRLSMLCAAAKALTSLSSTAATPLTPPTVKQPSTYPSTNPTDAAGKAVTTTSAKVGTPLALSIATSSLPRQQQPNRPTSEPQILTTANATNSAPTALPAPPLLPCPPRRLPSPRIPSSAPPPSPLPNIPPLSSPPAPAAAQQQQQQPWQEGGAAGAGIDKGNGGHTAAVLAQLASLKAIAHLLREAEERHRAKGARLQLEAEERRREEEERRRVGEAHRASNERMSSTVQILIHCVRNLEQEQAALKEGYATLAATQAELQEGHAGHAATIRDMQQQLEDLRLGHSRHTAGHARGSMGGVPAARADTAQGDEKGQDNDCAGGIKKRPSSEELDAWRTKVGGTARLTSQDQGSIGFGGGGGGGGWSR